MKRFLRVLLTVVLRIFLPIALISAAITLMQSDDV